VERWERVGKKRRGTEGQTENIIGNKTEFTASLSCTITKRATEHSTANLGDSASGDRAGFMSSFSAAIALVLADACSASALFRSSRSANK